MGMSESEERILSGRIWDDFCDRLKAAGSLVRSEVTPKDVQNQALGYRFLTRILRAGLEQAVDYSDTQYPAFYRLTTTRIAKSTLALITGFPAIGARSSGSVSGSKPVRGVPERWRVQVKLTQAK
jgi:hypothetical protein